MPADVPPERGIAGRARRDDPFASLTWTKSGHPAPKHCHPLSYENMILSNR